MSKWEEKRLGEISKIVSGGTPSTNNGEYWGGKIGWITPNDLSNYNKVHIKNGERNITEEGLKNSSAKLLPKQTVLLTTRAPIGYVVIADEVLATNQGFKNIICNPDLVNYRYMYYLLKSNKLTLESFATGATFPELSASTLKRIKFIFPPINIQHKIIDIISFYDDLIENNNLRIKLLEKAAQNLYKEWFVRFRFPNYKQTKFENGLPQGWEVVNIGDLVNVTSSKRVYLSDYIESGIPFYRSKEIIQLSTGKSITEPLFISEEKYIEFKSKFGAPQKNDILLTSVGTIGIPMLVSNNEPFYFKDGNLTWIQSSSNIELSYYLFTWLKSDIGKQQILSSTIGTSQSALTIENLKNIKLIMPLNEIIVKYKKFTEEIFSEINNLQDQNKNLIKQRDLLLPRLMSGKLEV